MSYILYFAQLIKNSGGNPYSSIAMQPCAWEGAMAWKDDEKLFYIRRQNESEEN